MIYLKYRHIHFSYIFSKYTEITSLVHSTLIRKLAALGNYSLQLCLQASMAICTPVYIIPIQTHICTHQYYFSLYLCIGSVK